MDALEGMCKLEDLVRVASAFDRDGFQWLCSGPALLLLSRDVEREDSEPETVFMAALDLHSTETGNTTRRPRRRPRGAGEVGPEAVVFLAKKSSENPFADVLTVGRSPANNLCLPFPTVSKVHALLALSEKGWTLSDQGATNGTFVREDRLPRHGSTALMDEIEIGFGPVATRFFTPGRLYALLRGYRAGG